MIGNQNQIKSGHHQMKKNKESNKKNTKTDKSKSKVDKNISLEEWSDRWDKIFGVGRHRKEKTKKN